MKWESNAKTKTGRDAIWMKVESCRLQVGRSTGQPATFNLQPATALTNALVASLRLCAFALRLLTNFYALGLGCCAVAADVGGSWHPAPGPLMTRWAAQVSPTNVHPEYPRPQLVRGDWFNLNGLWDYAITPSSVPAGTTFQGRILVRFPVEPAFPGVMKRLDETSTLCYRRKFTVPAEWRDRRVRLHFGAVDWQTRVTINGHRKGWHRGGYDSFTFD